MDEIHDIIPAIHITIVEREIAITESIANTKMNKNDIFECTCAVPSWS